MDFNSIRNDSKAVREILDKAPIGSFERELLGDMKNEFADISKEQGFMMAIAYAWQLGRICGISNERERKRIAKFKRAFNAAKMFEQLTPRVQDTLLESMREMVDGKAKQTQSETKCTV